MRCPGSASSGTSTTRCPSTSARFLALRERFTLVHVSDTPLPETNHHLPLGRGSVDLAVARRACDVPLILEIGGLPISGGPGLDTDEALLDSLARRSRTWFAVGLSRVVNLVRLTPNQVQPATAAAAPAPAPARRTRP